MRVSTKDLFRHCYGQYGIAAINVFTMEQVLAVFQAASISNSPVILQTTPVARDYASPQILLGMVNAAAMKFSNVVFALHLDHGNESHISEALKNQSYTSVMIDASHDYFEKNIIRTKKVVHEAHKQQVAVEAELGILSGVEDDLSINIHQANYTRPEEVLIFVRETNCDSLAIAVGTSHGAYKFLGNQGLQFNILERIYNELPNFPLVLHGGSAVDSNEVKRINNCGGKLESNARGVSNEEIIKAISYGICKINIATDLRILWTRVHREFFAGNADAFDPIIPGKIYVDELTSFCQKKFEIFGSTGKSLDFLSQYKS